MATMRFDLHLHTEYSPDCDTALSDIEPHCLNMGLTGIAVTDHDRIDGALRLRDHVKTLRVIVGEEVSTRDGDVIGLFVERHIPRGMSAEETIHAIHAQGGLAYLPHPFDKMRARRTGGASLSSIAGLVDIVEAFNGKVARDHYNKMAADFAHRHSKVMGAGSDAHSLRAIGTVYTEFPMDAEYSCPTDFLSCLRYARLTGKRRNPLGGWLIRGRRPFNLAWRKLRKKDF